MPLIEVKAFEQRFEDDRKSEQLIAALTEAMVEVYGEPAREETWVVLQGVAREHWGFGGAVRS